MTKRATLSTEAEAMRTAVTAHASAHYRMRLFITGSTPNSARAVTNIRKICKEHLDGRYDLEVVDIAQHPELTVGEQIIAAPTLIKMSPLPVRRFIGDMSWTDRILLGLNLRPAPPAASTITSI
ncbi:MAG: circadian clock KaiB family protein [Roseiarcus sp.]